MPRKKVVLAYSGGLDTACILKVLQEKDYDVIAYVADVGQQEDFDDVARRALLNGAVDVCVEDLKEEFVEDFILPAIAGNAVYENRYLLGNRPRPPHHRQAPGGSGSGDRSPRHSSHGARGKGNDQVRFELAYAALAPRAEVISPWKDREFLNRFQGRMDLLRYAEEHKIEVEATASKPYSSDENLMHRSYEAGILEDPMQEPPADMFKITVSPKDAPDAATRIEITFKDARPVAVSNLGDGTRVEGSLDIFYYLNELGGRNGMWSYRHGGESLRRDQISGSLRDAGRDDSP